MTRILQPALLELDWTPRALSRTRHEVVRIGRAFAVVRRYDTQEGPSCILGWFDSDQRARHVLSLYLNPWLLWR